MFFPPTKFPASLNFVLVVPFVCSFFNVHESYHAEQDGNVKLEKSSQSIYAQTKNKPILNIAERCFFQPVLKQCSIKVVSRSL